MPTIHRWTLTLGLASCAGPATPASGDTDALADTDAPADTDASADSDTDPPPDTDPPADTDPPVLTPPPGLTRWLTGAHADADVVPTGPGLILMGGGAEPDAAFHWWRDRLSGGDVVVLRASGSDGYNDYLFTDIGGADSVETLVVDRRGLADDAWVAARVASAEGVFIAGGDQWTYLEAWQGTALEAALQQAWSRGAVLGGTSAGLAILGDRVFSAERGTVYTGEALADPYNRYMRFEDDFLDLPPLAGVVTDSHFAERDRMGRLVAFMARMAADGVAPAPIGLGVDEGTALLVDADGTGSVVGTGAVYVVTVPGPPESCVSGEPLAWSGLQVRALVTGATLQLPGAQTTATPSALSVAGGETVPASPYR